MVVYLYTLNTYVSLQCHYTSAAIILAPLLEDKLSVRHAVAFEQFASLFKVRVTPNSICLCAPNFDPGRNIYLKYMFYFLFLTCDIIRVTLNYYYIDYLFYEYSTKSTIFLFIIIYNTEPCVYLITSP